MRQNPTCETNGVEGFSFVYVVIARHRSEGVASPDDAMSCLRLLFCPDLNTPLGGSSCQPVIICGFFLLSSNPVAADQNILLCLSITFFLFAFPAGAQAADEEQGGSLPGGLLEGGEGQVGG